MKARLPWQEREMARSRREMNLLRESVLAYLREKGPTPFAEIAIALNAKIGQMYKIATQLKANGMLYVYPENPGRSARRVWSLTPRPKIDREQKVRSVKPPIVTQDDLDWMAYWSLPRDERRLLRMRA